MPKQRNALAVEVRSPKYHMRVVADKRKKQERQKSRQKIRPHNIGM